MTKVLHIISDTNIGGAGRVLLNYLKYMDRANFGVSVLLPKGSLLTAGVKAHGVDVIELDAMHDKSFDLSAIRKIRRVIRDVEPQIVHTHGSFSGRIAAKRRGVPVVFTRHSAFPPNPRFTKGVGKLIFKTVNERYADRIIAVSPVCRDDLERCGVDPSRVDVILNGVDPLPRFDAGEREKLRAQYGVAPGEFAAGIIARIEPYKGHIYVLEAAKLLKEQGEKIKILVAGTGSIENEIKRQVKLFDLEDTVLFLGFVSDVGRLVAALDIQLNASYVEATSISLLEGMSAGLPAVVSDHGGNPYVIEDGVNGLIFKSRDSAALAGRIQTLMRDRVLLGKMGESSIAVYNSKFTGKILASEVEKTYRKTLEDTRNGR